MTETVSEFRQRVAAMMQDEPKVMAGQQHWYATQDDCGGSPEQEAWGWDIKGTRCDLFGDDSRIDAFLAAAVAAGVLRADE